MPLEVLSFVDIGCGSGLFSLAAYLNGVDTVTAFDIDPKCVSVSKSNLDRLSKNGFYGRGKVKFCDASILDDDFIAGIGPFDIVYAWGSLHHTGAMWEAIRNAVSLVKRPGGTLVLAIYNRHWTSYGWKCIKRICNALPDCAAPLLTYLLAPLIFVGAWVTTGKTPRQDERGMKFWYDVMDWLWGYPYEYATVPEIKKFIEPMGFQLTRLLKTEGWTGCNQFVFRRHPEELPERHATCP